MVDLSPPLSLSETPILAEEYPVRLPKNPAQAMLAKGIEPTSVVMVGNLDFLVNKIFIK